MTSQYAARRAAQGRETVLDRLEREGRDNAPMVELCARCPGWRHEGTAAACLAAGRNHRARLHPETVGWKRPARVKAARVERVKQPRKPPPSRSMIPAGIVAAIVDRNRAGESVVQLGEALFVELGYSSAKCCEKGIRSALRRAGVVPVKQRARRRSRLEMAGGQR